MLALNAVDSDPAGFHGIRMQNLAVPQVNAVMSDSLFGFVDSGIIGSFASFVRHNQLQFLLVDSDNSRGGKNIGLRSNPSL